MVVTQIGMNHTSGAVRVRGGMFKTGDLEMKTAEVLLGFNGRAVGTWIAIKCGDRHI